MKDSRQSPSYSSAEDVRDKDSKRTVDVSTPRKRVADMTIIENNPKIDRQLLEKYEHLVTASKGAIRVVQGADYNLAHPLASKDRPTDVHHLGKRGSAVKKA
jgi:hypothetical protein